MNTISVHIDKCKNDKCPHKNICYHKKRNEHNDDVKNHKMIRKGLDYVDQKDTNVYVAFCKYNSKIKDLLEIGCNITIPLNIYKKYNNLFDNYNDKIQVSIYSIDDITKYNIDDNVTKLFLIKDYNTLYLAIDILKNNDINNIHFPINKDWIETEFNKNKKIFYDLLNAWFSCINPTITLSSCLEGYIYNKQCPYRTNYIDINYNGTIRKCPFIVNGYKLKNKNKFDLDTILPVDSHYSCIYGFIINQYKGYINESKNRRN